MDQAKICLLQLVIIARNLESLRTTVGTPELYVSQLSSKGIREVVPDSICFSPS